MSEHKGYHKIVVEPLSNNQVMRLMRCERVRVCLRGTHPGDVLYVTEEQKKKIKAASAKGKAYTLQMHVEQAEKHASGGIFDMARNAAHHVYRSTVGHLHKEAKRAAPELIKKAATHARSMVDRAEAYASDRSDRVIDGTARRLGHNPEEESGALFPAGYQSGGCKKGRKRGCKGSGLWGDVGNIVDRFI